MFLKNICLRKTLNRAGLLPKEKRFQISDVMRMFWKLWKLIFFILRKLETFPFKCRLPEWAPRDSFHSRVIVLVGSQEMARTSRVATEKPALCKDSRAHRFKGQWKVGASGQWEWHLFKKWEIKTVFESPDLLQSIRKSETPSRKTRWETWFLRLLDCAGIPGKSHAVFISQSILDSLTQNSWLG